MAPVDSLDPMSFIKDIVGANGLVIFSKTTCGFCRQAKELFKSLNVDMHVEELDKSTNGPKIQDALAKETSQRTVPSIWIQGKHIGGASDVLRLHEEGSLTPLLSGLVQNKAAGEMSGIRSHNFDYDLIVIGGGSGGLAASKEAAVMGKKVALLDFVVPTPIGTSWGLGGTCVNVGCIPKKLMHHASLLKEGISDAPSFGWTVGSDVTMNWGNLVEAVQNHIGSLNWGYRVALRDKKVQYINAYGTLVDANTVKTVDKKNRENVITGQNILLATGLRPRYPGIPGDKEFCITSDDLFSLPYPPGKTLCVGASYVSLECAGFLKGFGFDVTVMVRSILLRGFDQQMAELVGGYMERQQGIKFHRECVPIKIEKIAEGTPPTLRVSSKFNSGEVIVEEYNTVLLAIGRDACTTGIGLENVGVALNPKNGKVICDESERSSVPNIFAIGDILDGKLELTPVAIHAGKFLARRLFGYSKVLTDYINVPTTVFTPLEYGCIGYAEEDANDKFGADNVEVYHTYFTPLEWTVPKKGDNLCYAKLIVTGTDEKVVGFHYLGPNAGEVTQGYGIAFRLGATKADFDNLIGIHPTTAENFTTLSMTRRDNPDPKTTGC